MRLKKLKCYNCKTNFTRILSQYNRQKKKGRKQFCCKECFLEYCQKKNGIVNCCKCGREIKVIYSALKQRKRKRHCERCKKERCSVELKCKVCGKNYKMEIANNTFQKHLLFLQMQKYRSAGSLGQANERHDKNKMDFGIWNRNSYLQ